MSDIALVIEQVAIVLVAGPAQLLAGIIAPCRQNSVLLDDEFRFQDRELGGIAAIFAGFIVSRPILAKILAYLLINGAA